MGLIDYGTGKINFLAIKKSKLNLTKKMIMMLLLPLMMMMIIIIIIMVIISIIISIQLTSWQFALQNSTLFIPSRRDNYSSCSNTLLFADIGS